MKAAQCICSLTLCQLVVDVGVHLSLGNRICLLSGFVRKSWYWERPMRSSNWQLRLERDLYMWGWGAAGSRIRTVMLANHIHMGWYKRFLVRMDGNPSNSSIKLKLVSAAPPA